MPEPSNSGNRKPATTSQQIPGDRAPNSGSMPNPSPANPKKPATRSQDMPSGGSGGNSLNEQ